MNSEIHTILVTVLGALAVAAALGSATALIRRAIDADRTNRRIGQFVLPHFEPPTPEEIRQGSPDLTIPARIESLEMGHISMERTLQRSTIAHEKGAEDLKMHLIVEEQQSNEASEREIQRDKKIDILMETINPNWDGNDRRQPTIQTVRKSSSRKKAVVTKSRSTRNTTQTE